MQEALDKPRNIHFKGVTDLVTDTDRASEEAILQAISSGASTHGTKVVSITLCATVLHAHALHCMTVLQCTHVWMTWPLIIQVLQQQVPDHGFLGEEGGVSGNANSEYLWCIDPIDGTTNFAAGYPSFAVSVAGSTLLQPFG